MLATDDLLLIKLVIWLAFGTVCALIAHNRGRTPIGWFFIGVAAPCIGLILVLALPDLKLEQERQEKLRRENRRLKERLRKDRQIADQRHAAVQERLEVHDEALGLDTSRKLAPPTEPSNLEAGDSPPPPPSKPEAKKLPWYYLIGEERCGPVSGRELKSLWREGKLRADSLVWRGDMSDWRAIEDIPGLEKALND